MQQKEAGGGRAAMGRNGLQKQLIRQFYRGNIPAFVLAVAAALAAGSLNIILSWIIQQLIDAASGIPGARSLAELAKISGGLVALCVALSLLKYAAQRASSRAPCGSIRTSRFTSSWKKASRPSTAKASPRISRP